MVDQARNDGYGLVTLPHNIRQKLRGLIDDTGAPVRGLDVFTREWVDSFEIEFVEETRLTAAERAVFTRRDEIAALAGGWPKGVREVLVSTTMRPNEDGRNDAVGLWEEAEGRIIIKRDQLGSLREFAGTLLHEITHARTGEGDISREFELALTDLIGALAAKALPAAPGAPAPTRARRRAAPVAASSAPRSGSASNPARTEGASRKSSKPAPRRPNKAATPKRLSKPAPRKPGRRR